MDLQESLDRLKDQVIHLQDVLDKYDLEIPTIDQLTLPDLTDLTLTPILWGY